MACSEHERRRYPRIEVGIAVDYHVLGVIENISFGQTKNSSVGGTSPRSSAMPPPPACAR